MLRRSAYSLMAGALLVIPLLIVGVKNARVGHDWQELLPKEAYTVAYEFDLFHLPPDAFVAAYVPESNARQTIRSLGIAGDSLEVKTNQNSSGVMARWQAGDREDAVFQHAFAFEGKEMSFQLPVEAPLEAFYPDSIADYLLGTEAIQVTDPQIRTLADNLKKADFTQTVQANFNYVASLTSTGTNVLTDAVTALKRQRASCNGKSRLFVALCRAQGIPARVAGGIILERSEKRTSHLWTEVFYGNQWIPFDVLNDHFATIPANYLELYRGDEFLISHTPDIGFDYQFIIDKQYHSISKGADYVPAMWSLLKHELVSLDVLRTILLLPVAALLIVLLKNVVGMKTFGVFLPALISLSLVDTNLYWTIGAFAAVLLVISGLHYALDRLGLLHTPKLVIMLLAVILTLLLLGQLGYQMNWANWTSVFMLPLVILAIAAERFAKVLTEENFGEAMKMLGSTLLVALLCYPIFSSELLIGFLLTFPELYLSMIGLLLLLGRWIGLRLMEHFRFSPLLASN